MPRRPLFKAVPDPGVTLGLGYPFAQGKTGHEPMIMVGGEQRTSDRLKLVAELWKIPGADQIPTIFGMRFFGDRIAVDFGLMYVFGTQTSGLPFLPWVDFVVNW